MNRKQIFAAAAFALVAISAMAESEIIPLPSATKRQMQMQAENAESKRQASKAKAKPEKVQDIGQAKALACYAPRPQYPIEARSRHITGSGEFALRFDYDTGLCTGYKTLHSTGSLVLDNAALAAFRQWRMRPKTCTVVRIPMTFTIGPKPAEPGYSYQ
jgi:TonB family protein